MWPFTKRRVHINLALQGGGAHGAFTWGVLDRLLQEEWLHFDSISGTSAGAINAVALVDGLSENGKEGARSKLADIWKKIYESGVPGFLRFNPLLSGMYRAAAAASASSLTTLTNVFSPYEFNPLDINPLETILNNHIDFERLRRNATVKLRIAATEVSTGKAHIFLHNDISVEVILASACLPNLHKAVEINEKHYWDGGFSANPELISLILQTKATDTLIILLNPLVIDELPTTAKTIARRINQITFNQPFLRDIQMIDACRRIGKQSHFFGHWNRVLHHHFHLIRAGSYTSKLSEDSKMKPDWALFMHLFDAGRNEADSWITSSRNAIGRYSTANLGKIFLT